MPIPVNVTNPLLYLSGANTLTSDLFWPLMILSMWIITFLGIYKKDPVGAFTISSFICALVSGFFWLGNLVSIEFVILVSVLTGIGVLGLYIKERVL